MQLPFILLPLFSSLVVAIASTSIPTSVTDYYCRKNDFKAEICRHLSLEDILLMKRGMTSEEAQDARPEALCRSAGRTPEQCVGKTKSWALCLLSGRTEKECQESTTAAHVCLEQDRTWEDCRQMRIEEAVCISFGFTPKVPCARGECPSRS